MSKRSHDDDDDDDYMSDKILAAASQAAAPQLLNPRRRLPPAPPAVPVPNEKSRRRVQEIEQREQGLSTAITSDNKGYQLLKKMGYKEGSKLGNNSPHGLAEPIAIRIHPSRWGLGEESEKKEKVRLKEEVKSKFTRQIQSTYQDHLKHKYYSKRLRSDIDKCQAVCERLDREKLHLEESALWKSTQDEEKEEDIDEEDDETNEQCQMEAQLQRLTCYLRETHCYCVWCGQAFETSEELQETCPGNERDLHWMGFFVSIPSLTLKT